MKTVVLSLLVIFCLGSVFSSEQQTKVHDKLSDAQFKNIFRRERRDVPDYKFVNIKSKSGHRQKRELRPVEFEVDNKKVELNLHPAEHVVMSDYVPVWIAKTEEGQQYRYQDAAPEEKKIGGIFYEDRENMATLLAYYKDRYIYYDGIFGESEESKVVKSAPEEWRSGVSGNAENHFIFNVSASGQTIALQPDEIDKISHKLEKPLDTFYPKLLVIVDYPLFEKLGKDVQETVRYMATFWNAVNLKYSKIENPKIKIMVTGLIIATDPSAMEYIDASRTNEDPNIQLNPNKVLTLGGRYFRDEFYNATKFQNYDATITLSSAFSGSVLGLAYVGAICDDIINVGYVRDDGSFGGVLPATHELGHLLSLPHDGNNGCDGYADGVGTVMAAWAASVKEYIWSECSKKSLQKFAWDEKSSCMKDYYRYRH